MATSVASVTSHFPDAENGFTTTTAGSASSGAVTVTLNSVAGYTNGEPVVLVIDPTDAAKKQTFTGIVDTSGVQITSVVWTAGTNQVHALGATVVDYATATHIAMISKGIKVEHAQAGTHKAELITSRTEDTAPDVGADFLLTYDTSATALKKVKPSNLGITTGWTAGQLPAVSSVTNNGNRSYDVTFASTVASLLTPGMRVRTSRTVAAPAGSFYCDGVNDYFSKTTPNKLTFTDDFVVSAWINLLSYPAGGSLGCIMSAGSATSGWALWISDTGQVLLNGRNAAAANFSRVTSYQSIPLNKWVHITAQLDMSAFTATTTTSYVMIDGVDVPSSVSRGGTNPTALVQAGNLEIGRLAGDALYYLNGRIAQVAVFNAKVTQATMRGYISQGLAGTETSLASAYSGATLTDLNTTTPNDLTANGGALNAQGYAPFGDNYTSTTYDYAIVTKVVTTVATVQVPESCAIPTSGGVSTVDYATTKSPFGMPVNPRRWQIETIQRGGNANNGASTADTYYNVNSFYMSVPIGSFRLVVSATVQASMGSATAHGAGGGIGTASGNSRDIATSTAAYSASLDVRGTIAIQAAVDNSSATTYYINIGSVDQNATALFLVGSTNVNTFIAIPDQL